MTIYKIHNQKTGDEISVRKTTDKNLLAAVHDNKEVLILRAALAFSTALFFVIGCLGVWLVFRDFSRRPQGLTFFAGGSSYSFDGKRPKSSLNDSGMKSSENLFERVRIQTSKNSSFQKSFREEIELRNDSVEFSQWIKDSDIVHDFVNNLTIIVVRGGNVCFVKPTGHLKRPANFVDHIVKMQLGYYRESLDDYFVDPDRVENVSGLGPAIAEDCEHFDVYRLKKKRS